MRSKKKRKAFPGGSLVKNLHSLCRGTGLIPGQGTKIPHDSWPNKKKKERKKKKKRRGGTVDKKLPANAGDTGWISGLETFHMSRGN